MALGDSYSSGLGTFKYYNSGNSCHRSELGYPPYIAKKRNFGEFTFAACSGAVTDDFFVANPKNANEPAQLSRLTPETEVVTLTIGGNDVGFEPVMKRCVNHPKNKGWGCAKDTALAKGLKERLSGLAGKPNVLHEGRPVHSVSKILQEIKKAAPNAKVYIAGYPTLFGDQKGYYKPVKDAPGGYACFVPIVASVAYEDAKWLNKQTRKLNGIIESEVEVAQRAGVQAVYVPPDSFSGHVSCDQSYRWMNEVVSNGADAESVQPESFHPNSEGYYLGYGLVFEMLIRKR